MATHTPPVQTKGGPSTADEGEFRTSTDVIVTHDRSLLESDSTHSRKRVRKINYSTKKFISRISDTVTRAFTPSSTTNSMQNLPASSAEGLMPLTDGVTAITNNKITELGSPRPPVTRSETPLDRTADDPSQTPSPWSDTATSPEACSWISSRPLQAEIGWIFASSSTDSRSSNIRRIASCLRRALWHTYITPVEEYVELTYPGQATGAKKRYMSDPSVSRFKRGAKGLKKRGDKDVPFKRFVPNGLKLRPLNDKLFATVGCFFPQPSKMRYVEVADYSTVKEGGSDQENVRLPAVAGEAPTDYHGPAKGYAGSLSSDSDSSDSNGSATSTLSNIIDFDSSSPPSNDEDVSASRHEVTEDSVGSNSDNILSENPSPNDSADMVIPNEDEFGIFDGLNEPYIRLHAEIPEFLEDLREVIDDGFDHHLVELLVPCVRPMLPAGYAYAAELHSTIPDDPYYIVPDDSGCIRDGGSQGLGEGSEDTEQEMPQWLKSWVHDAEEFIDLVQIRATEEALVSVGEDGEDAVKETRFARLEHENSLQHSLDCVSRPPRG